ncbi:FtsX-like permease family protein [Nitrosomonas sp.]|uniref:ABC transporter permease n=1 Tax=Nitrosomonas sp. TaxID=42353 RepID=UPI0028484CA1|nr:FtsX-like permease family protein [Nitrosomonas sp.]MDR4513973.1 FtsX-like permease family protein [Nitrosomonas sp.]
MQYLRLSMLMLRRDWRAGELYVLILALIIAISGMTTVAFFADRVDKTLSQESNQLLGADLLIISTRPLSEHYAEEAQRRDLDIAKVTQFPSMVSNGDNNQLVQVKAVTDGYPLRGKLHLAGASAEPGNRVTTRIPKQGTLWFDEKMLAYMDLRRGDPLEIGAIQLTASALIMREPDHSVGFIHIAPRVMINAADLPATGLIQEGSRVTYQLLIAGEFSAVEAYRSWAEKQIKAVERIEGIRDARPEIKSALERAEKFLNLSALVSVVLAAAAIALAVRRFTQRHLDGCAIMRSMGASQHGLFILYLFYFIALGMIASLIGCLIGFAAQEVLTAWLSDLADTAMPLPSYLPAVHGFLVCIVLLLGFALPPILNLRSVPALRVLRRDIGMPNTHSVTGYLLGLATLSLLFLWKAGDLKLGLFTIAGFIIAVAVFGLIGLVLVKVLSGLRRQTGSAWRYGLANIRRRAISSIVQAVSLGLGFMALLVLTLVQDDLIKNWHTTLPPDAPNHFLVNIQSDQLPLLENFFNQHTIETPPTFPMVRGRLVEINNKKITPEDYDDPHAANHVRRDFNLSWSAELPQDNLLVHGDWWDPEHTLTEPIVSLEEGIARTLRVKPGDQLTFDIAGSTFSATITNLRKVEWDSFRVNFFVIAPPGFLENYPVNYVSSFYLPPSDAKTMHELVKAFPNILVIDVAAVVKQVQEMIQQLSRAIEFVFLFTLMAGFIVLYAAIAATQDERIREAAIFRTLGAKRKQLTRTWAAEFVILGGLAGLFASAGASLLGYAIGNHVLHLVYSFNPWIWVIGVCVGTAGVLIAGMIGTRTTLTTPPLLTLRKIG